MQSIPLSTSGSAGCTIISPLGFAEDDEDDDELDDELDDDLDVVVEFMVIPIQE